MTSETPKSVAKNEVSVTNDEQSQQSFRDAKEEEDEKTIEA